MSTAGSSGGGGKKKSSFPSVKPNDGNVASRKPERGNHQGNKEGKKKTKKGSWRSPFLPFRQVMYLHGLHHKLSWSSPNKARHFFGVFASVIAKEVRTQTKTHTHTGKKRQQKQKNGHVIAQTN